jgi:thymidylate kinase
MVFIALEGFSGTGKTTISRLLARRGWVAIPESAHFVPKTVPLADRGNTYSDYALIGATLTSSYDIVNLRRERNVVADGYIVSDLTYSKIRYERGQSKAYPVLRRFVFSLLKDKLLVPDLFVVLKADEDTIYRRQKYKEEREKNINIYFMERYYKILYMLHREMGHNFTNLSTDERKEKTERKIVEMVEKL